MLSIRIRAKVKGGQTEIRVLIEHPMETGRNKDKNGELIPAHFIRELSVQRNAKTVVSAALGAGISKDPYFAFYLKDGAAGDKISVSWTDNLGNSDSAVTEVK
jgi:sulfur-oxidizing protein SoxZ